MEEKKFAVLIDSDNVSSKYVKIILDEITNLGVATIKRIYGDWTNGKTHWKSVLLDYALTPMQQYAYTSGKNSTDSAMIIDAMDILYTGDVDGFCIASSDSDFTKLATRLREAGKIVIGMGEKHTPQPFVKACSQFKYIDLISANQSEAAKTKAKTQKSNTTQAKSEQSTKKKTDVEKTESAGKSEEKSEIAAPIEEAQKAVTAEEQSKDTATPIEEIKSAILQIMEDSDDENGLILASTVGSILQHRFPDFDCRNYGCKRMTDLLNKLNVPTVKYDDPNNPAYHTTIVYIKAR